MLNKILISGAGGMVGRAVRNRLLLDYDKGEIICTDYIPNGRLNIKRMDVTSGSEIHRMIDGRSIDAILHLAALVAGPPSEKKPQEYLEVNVMGTVNILEKMRRYDIPKIVYLSSWSTFGTDITLPIDESTEQNPRNPYGTSKVMAEKAVKLYSELYGLEAVVLRPTMLYAPLQHEKNIVQQVVDCMVSGETFEIWGEGTHTRELLHADDMANIVFDSLHYDPDGGYDLFIVGTETPLSVIDVATAGQEISHFPIKFVPSNKWVFDQRSDMTKLKMRVGINPDNFINIKDGLFECYRYRLGNYN